MGDALFMTCRRRATRQRRDRVAHQIALTITTAMLLLVTGGVWWLFSDPVPGGSGGGIDRLLVLERPAAPVRQSQPPAPSPKQAAEDRVEPRQPAITHSGPMFNGKPLRKSRTIRMLVTAYSPDARSCGKWADNITASGYSVWTNGMKLVAADPRLLRYGSIISVPGYDNGDPVPVLDCGGAIKGHRLDVLFPTHEAARQWGKRWLDVTVWEYRE